MHNGDIMNTEDKENTKKERGWRNVKENNGKGSQDSKKYGRRLSGKT